MDQFDTSPEDSERRAAEEQATQRAAVEQLIAMRLRDAVQAKENSGIEQIWLDDEDQYNGFDERNPPTPGAAQVKDASTQGAKKASPRSTVFLNITKPKTDTAVSRVTEMLLPHDDKPWEVGPTPIPELDRAAAGSDPRMIQLADGKQASAQDVAKAAILKAQESAGLMTNQIEDWFVEGDVYAQMRHVIRDAGRIGSGVLKGPMPCMKTDRKWSVKNGVSEMVIAERLAPTSRRIDPWDLFPDPSCGDDIHAGSYLFERDYLTGRKLRELAKVPGYDQQAIAEILAEGPRKRARADRFMREKPGEAQDFDTGTFEVFFYYGDIPPEQIVAGGFTVPGLIDAEGDDERAAQIEQAMQLATVSVVATTVNDRIVRVSMNPLETGEFPFDVFPWEPVDGQPWGRGVPRKMAVAQRMLNAATRAMLENAGMSAGPQVVIAKGSVVPADGNYTINGRKLWFWTPSDEVKDIRMAFASVMIDSAQQQLQAIIDFALRMADELSNLPLLLQGAVGSAPDTVGGMAMLQQNAASPLKAIAKQYDDRLIVPHLKRYYAWAMQDPNVKSEAKGDMQCKARGSTALIQRDQAGVFLAQLMPLVKDPAFKANPEKWFAELMRANKFNPASIQYTDEEAKAIAEQQGEAPPDPRIAAAQINAQAKQADREAAMQGKSQELQFKAQDAQADREHDERIKDVEFQIQAMEFAGQKEISLETLKAMLATKSMDIRNKREMFAAERQFAVTEGEGRGL